MDDSFFFTGKRLSRSDRRLSGTPVGVQQRLMRHADIRTTMNIYGDAMTPDMREAHGKIVGLALNGMGNGMDEGPSN